MEKRTNIMKAHPIKVSQQNFSLSNVSVGAFTVGDEIEKKKTHSFAVFSVAVACAFQGETSGQKCHSPLPTSRVGCLFSEKLQKNRVNTFAYGTPRDTYSEFMKSKWK